MDIFHILIFLSMLQRVSVVFFYIFVIGNAIQEDNTLTIIQSSSF